MTAHRIRIFVALVAIALAPLFAGCGAGATTGAAIGAVVGAAIGSEYDRDCRDHYDPYDPYYDDCYYYKAGPAEYASSW